MALEVKNFEPVKKEEVVEEVVKPDNFEQGKPSGSARVIQPERRVDKKSPPNLHLDDIDNPKVTRLCAIAGRNLGTLGLLHEGDVAWGFLNLLNVDTNEQITVFPDAKVPEGLWVPVNHLPQSYLDTLE